ncbi:flagellar hook-associated protein FlgK [Gemmatimonas sp.]|jgi:flagellar hook-associated protein 1 FlgK|uniref:flagellar hook-associated protein FlgK n=1 Tax=Gemmatimonas sp. TaxID=1962908 RepID=UPI0037BEE067
MSSGLFNIARSALLTHQTALQTISQNVANAETPGYSRQEAVVLASTPVRLPFGSVGTGVSVSTIIRKRDALLDDSFRSANTLSGDATLRRDLLSQIEAVFGEPSELGLANALDQFWNSWSDLSASPDGLAARAVVQQRGRQLGQLFNAYDTQLTTIRSQTLERLDNTVERINALALQLAELNVRIVSAESGGNTANDLRDLRDLRLDELAKVAGTRVMAQPDGSVSVLIGNSTLIHGDTATPLSVWRETPNPLPATPLTDVPVRIQLGTASDRLAPIAGELSAMVDVINTELPGTRGRLDAMAVAVVNDVNTLHRGGFTFSGATIPGTTAGNFFDPGTVTAPVRAASMTLQAAIVNDLSKIAASGNVNGPTDNAIAQRISSLRSLEDTVSWTAPNGSTETGSFSGFFRGLVTRLGIQTATVSDQATVAEGLVTQADFRRQSASGVNTDEELVHMLRVQQSYQAAAKIIKVAEDMLDTLISLA